MESIFSKLPAIFTLFLFLANSSWGSSLATCLSLGGVRDGSRCWFIGRNPAGTQVPVDWVTAWAICRNNSAVLAQIFTMSEFNKIFSMTQNFAFANNLNFWNGIIALRDIVQSQPPWAMTNTTYFYDNENTPNTNLIIYNTMARWGYPGGGGDDSNTAVASRCFGESFLDDACDSNLWFPICQVSDYNDNYTSTSVCLTDNPVEILPASTAQDCAQLCACRGWCRSFNFMVSPSLTNCAYECHLFTFSINDGCPNCPSTQPSSSTCVHFTYVP